MEREELESKSFMMAIRILISIPEFVDFMRTIELFDYEDDDIYEEIISSEDKKQFNKKTFPFYALHFLQKICDQMKANSVVEIEKEIKKISDLKNKEKLSKYNKDTLYRFPIVIIDNIIESIRCMYRKNNEFVEYIDGKFGHKIYQIQIDESDSNFNKLIITDYFLKEIKKKSDYIILQLKSQSGTQALDFIMDELKTDSNITYNLYGVISVKNLSIVEWHFDQYDRKTKKYKDFIYNSTSPKELDSLEKLYDNYYFSKNKDSLIIVGLIYKKCS